MAQIFGKLDAAVNNAGYTGSPGPLTTQTAEAYDTVFNTNVRGLPWAFKPEVSSQVIQIGAPSQAGFVSVPV